MNDFWGFYKGLFPVISVVVLFLAFLSLRYKGKENNLLFIFCILNFFWLILTFLILISKDPIKLYFLSKSYYLVVCFIPTVVYHFIICGFIKKDKLLIPFYICSIILSILAILDFLAKGINKFSWGYFIKAGPLHPLHIIFVIFLSIRGFYFLFKNLYLSENWQRKKQIQYLTLGLLIYLFSAIDYLPKYGINIIPLGLFFIFGGFLTFSYGILRYHLLDIPIYITKAGSIGMITGVFLFSLFILTNMAFPFLIEDIHIRGFLSGVVLAIFVFCFYFSTKKIIKLSEQKVLKERYMWIDRLKEAVVNLSQAKSLRQMLLYIVRNTRKLLGLDFAAVAIREKQKDKNVYVIKKVSSINPQKPSLSFLNKVIPEESFIISYLKETQNPIEIGLLDFLLKKRGLDEKERKYLKELKQEAEKLGVDYIVGSFSENNQVSALLLLGKRYPYGVFSEHQKAFLQALSYELSKPIEAEILKRQQINLLLASQEVLLKTIEAKDNYTYSHSKRVKNLSAIFARESDKLRRMLVNNIPEGIWGLEISAALHDLGKIAIPDLILNKKERLSEEEWEYIKQHPIIGIKIIDYMRDWLGDNIFAGVLEHQEHYGGGGYPCGKKQVQIHPYARIIHIIDAFDAMTSERPYKLRPLSEDEAIEELLMNKHKQFDPEITDEFIKFLKRHDLKVLKEVVSKELPFSKPIRDI